MQWNCPHCGIILAVSDDMVGAGWSFSRCYKCGGFALIRRTEINVIKVDKAPSGERVILPESSYDPTAGLLNGAAAQKLERSYQNSEKLAETLGRNEKPVIRPVSQISKPRSQPNLSESLPPPPPGLSQFHLEGGLPRPLPELLEARRTKRLHLGISAASSAVLISGLFLFLQDQSIWKKADAPASPAKAKPIMLTDRVEQTAPAPVEPRQILSALGEPSLARESTPKELKGTLKTPLNLKIRVWKANLHTGPGLEYPVLGTVPLGNHYIATEWKEEWFKISLKNGSTLMDAGWVRNDLVQIL